MLIALNTQILLDTTSGFVAIVTVAGSKTYELYAARTGTAWTSSQFPSDGNGYSVIDWVKLNV